jgi:hypothetical protein
MLEYLPLEIKERLEAKLAEIQKELKYPERLSPQYHNLKGQEDATKEALEIVKDAVEYHEEELEEEY